MRQATDLQKKAATANIAVVNKRRADAKQLNKKPRPSDDKNGFDNPTPTDATDDGDKSGFDNPPPTDGDDYNVVTNDLAFNQPTDSSSDSDSSSASQPSESLLVYEDDNNVNDVRLDNVVWIHPRDDAVLYKNRYLTYDPQKHKVGSKQFRRSVCYQRAESYLANNIAADTITEICNKEASFQGGTTVKSSLLHFMNRTLDIHSEKIKVKEFSNHQDGGEKSGIPLTKNGKAYLIVETDLWQGHLQSMLCESMLLMLKRGYRPNGRYVKCDSMSQVHNSRYFEKFYDKVQTKNPGSLALAVSWFSDGTNDGDVKFHPFYVLLQCFSGYLLTNTSIFETVINTMGFLPETFVVWNVSGDTSKKVQFDKLSKSDKQMVSRAVFGAVLDHFGALFSEQVGGGQQFVFQDLLPGFKCQFGLYVFVKDKVEAGFIQNEKHCSICTMHTCLIINRDYHRNGKVSDSAHSIGPQLENYLNKDFDVATTVSDFTLPIGRMHTVANTLKHACTILILGLFAKPLEEFVFDGKNVLVASSNGFDLGLMTDRNEFISGGHLGGAVPKFNRYTTRESSCRNQDASKPKSFASWAEWCKKKTGPFSMFYLHDKDRMWKRLFGFAYTCLALCITVEQQVLADMETLKELQEFFVDLYQVTIRLYDASPGQIFGHLRVLLPRLRTNWLRSAVRSGVYSLSIACHQYFHCLVLMEDFGSMASYAEDFYEKHNKTVKLAVRNNSSHRKGTFSQTYLSEGLTREMRKRIFRLMECKTAKECLLEWKDSSFVLNVSSHFSSTSKVLFEKAIKRIQTVFDLDASRIFLKYTSGNEQWCFGGFSIGVTDKNQVSAIGVEQFFVIGEQSLDSLEILAISPATDMYKAWVSKRPACIDDGCIPCLGVEFGKSLSRNEDPITSDLIFLPVAFRSTRNESGQIDLGEILGFMLTEHSEERKYGLTRTDGNMFGGLGVFTLHLSELKVVDVSRVRGSSHFVVFQKGKNNRASYLDVFRGKPGI